MLLPKSSDAIHKAWLYRVLSAIADDAFLAENLRFKGGTCAAMRGIINRFSVDLDFDLLDNKKLQEIKKSLEKAFSRLGLEIKDQSKLVPQYFLKYQNPHGLRNTLKIDVTFPPPKSNDYEAIRFSDIDRVFYCQTIPTMFANKLVTTIERFEKYGSIAGRDLFDLHSFFLKGLGYKKAVIEERRGQSIQVFLESLKKFIEKKFSQTVIDQDLNMLLPAKDFRHARKYLKQEVLMFLADEIKRIKKV